MPNRTGIKPPRRTATLRSRRAVLRIAAAAAITAPWIVENAFSSSGSLDFMGWSGFDLKPLFHTFTAKTGIRMNFIAVPDNATMFAKAKLAFQSNAQASTQDGGIDCLEPTLDLVPQYLASGLAQPWDMTRIDLNSYEPALVTGGIGDRSAAGGRRYFLPSSWGTEALVFDTVQNVETYGLASLADLFDPKNQGKVVLRAATGLAAMGRVLDAQGKLPAPFLDGFRDQDTMRKIWDVVLAEAIKHKDTIARFWNIDGEAQDALRNGGCTLGLCWESTGFRLQADGFPFSYVAPKEGAFAWSQGYMLAAGAKNVAQAEAWAKFIATPEGGMANARAFGANPAAKGAMGRADPAAAKFYQDAYPGDALSRLWWWPPQPGWFLKMRADYAGRFKAA